MTQQDRHRVLWLMAHGTSFVAPSDGGLYVETTLGTVLVEPTDLAAVIDAGQVEFGPADADGIPERIELTEAGRYWLRKLDRKYEVRQVV